MQSLTIQHVTTYRYKQPVSFGEHRMMFRPRDSDDQRVIGASLDITPLPTSLRFVQDRFGNHVGIANFAGRSMELCFKSLVSLEHCPLDTSSLELEEVAGDFPVIYSAIEMCDLADCMDRRHVDPGNKVNNWAHQFLLRGGSVGIFALLNQMSANIHDNFVYRRREARGIQEPAETLRLGHGSCRDFAMLLIEAARALGLAARFASGYLAEPINYADEPVHGTARGSTHAWAQIYLPRAGWIDFDPTSGNVGQTGLVTVAVVRDPIQAIPLHGTFVGSASDHLGMEVEVRVTSDAHSAI